MGDGDDGAHGSDDNAGGGGDDSDDGGGDSIGGGGDSAGYGGDLQRHDTLVSAETHNHALWNTVCISCCLDQRTRL